jgi:hypothetical protein
MAPSFADVYTEKYLLLTTFTRDGARVEDQTHR